MKLSEVFSELLSAEEKSNQTVKNARDSVDALRSEARAKIEGARKTSLEELHVKSELIEKNARADADSEILKIKNAASAAAAKITELFERNAADAMTRLADDVALACVSRARAES